MEGRTREAELGLDSFKIRFGGVISVNTIVDTSEVPMLSVLTVSDVTKDFFLELMTGFSLWDEDRKKTTGDTTCLLYLSIILASTPLLASV